MPSLKRRTGCDDGATLNERTEQVTDNTNTSAHSIRSWLGIPYATAERFRRPVLLPFDPDLPYDQKGPAPLQAGDTSWLEADNGFQ